MRILLVHNFYGSSSPSGENQVVLEERDLLRQAGYDVIDYFTYSDTVRNGSRLAMIRAGVLVPWNASARAALSKTIRELCPDIMHVHNVFPLLSASVFGAATGTRTAVVNTLHNYRAVCGGGAALRRGRVCTDCLDRSSAWPSLLHGCYRGSRLATLPLAASVTLHRRLNTYARHVDAIVVLTKFQKSLLVGAGLPEQSLYVKPNCFPGRAGWLPWELRDGKVMFIGRASPEKGLHVLLEAWKQWGSAAPLLEIVGSGSDLERLRQSIPSENKENVIFRGAKSSEETQALLSKARLLIIPSVCFEGFPLVLREALAFGVPVVASRLGALQEVVESGNVGRLFTPGDSSSLRQTVSSIWNDDTVLRALSCAALQEAATRYSPAANLAVLEEIYRRAIGRRRARMRQEKPR